MADTDAATLTEETTEGGDETERLDLTVKIDPRSACERHITVTVGRDDIDRYLDKAYSKLMPEAQVPGFRAGRAPRKLVESRFRKEISEQVRGEILLDSVSQVTEDEKLAAISEPDFDPLAIEIPDEGPMTFEFDLEVRPEFDLPDWKGLKIERPQHDFSDDEVADRIQELLIQHSFADQAPKDGPAELGDFVGVDIVVRHKDKVVNTLEEEVVRVLPTLSFRDGNVTKFDKLMQGAKEGDTREAKFRLMADAYNEELRGKEVVVEFKVLEVRQLAKPEIDSDVLEHFGVDTEEQLREAVKTSMNRQLGYQAEQRVREQITTALVKSADWELPPEMLRRQATRELERSMLELRRSGFSEQEIRAHANELRQNSAASTSRALKEHFILERIAEEEKIEEQPEDYDLEIELIAMQLGDTPRKVRARIEKNGQMDVLRNQIIERKVLTLIKGAANFKDTAYEVPTPQVEAIEHSAGGHDAEHEIPEAHVEYTPEEHPGRPENEKD